MDKLMKLLRFVYKATLGGNIATLAVVLLLISRQALKASEHLQPISLKFLSEAEQESWELKGVLAADGSDSDVQV